jgi:hypothetical protein
LDLNLLYFFVCAIQPDLLAWSVNFVLLARSKLLSRKVFQGS